MTEGCVLSARSREWGIEELSRRPTDPGNSAHSSGSWVPACAGMSGRQPYFAGTLAKISFTTLPSAVSQ